MDFELSITLVSLWKSCIDSQGYPTCTWLNNEPLHPMTCGILGGFDQIRYGNFEHILSFDHILNSVLPHIVREAPVT